MWHTFLIAFKQIGVNEKELDKSVGSLTGFNCAKPLQLDSSSSILFFEELLKCVDLKIEYVVTGIKSPHNVILGRPFLNAFGIIISTLHQAIKFPMENGIGQISSNQAQFTQLLLEFYQEWQVWIWWPLNAKGLWKKEWLRRQPGISKSPP